MPHWRRDATGTRQQAIAATCKREADQIDRQIQKLLDRFVEAGLDAVIRAFEKRITKLKNHALVLREKSERAGRARQSFYELFELAVAFLANPSKLLASRKIDQRNTVLRETDFCRAFGLLRRWGFRTQKNCLSSFSILSDLGAAFEEMSERVGSEPTVRLTQIV
jgi:hypothetical protein